MTIKELKELVDSIYEDYNNEYIEDKEVIIEFHNNDGKYHSFGIDDWKFNQTGDSDYDCLYLRGDDAVPVFYKKAEQ